MSFNTPIPPRIPGDAALKTLEVQDLKVDGDMTITGDVTIDGDVTCNSLTTTTFVSAGTAVTAGTTVTAGTGMTSTTGNIVATAGQVNAGTTMTAGTGMTATTGNIVATAGAVSAGTTVTAGTGISATTGNITAVAGSLISNTANVNSATGCNLGFGTTPVLDLGSLGTTATVNIADAAGSVGFYGVTAVPRPTTAVSPATFVANTSGIADDSATFGGYTIGQIVTALKSLGALT